MQNLKIATKTLLLTMCKTPCRPVGAVQAFTLNRYEQ